MTVVKIEAIVNTLQDALRREAEAFNYYHRASLKSPFEETRALLIQLAEEERKHRVFLQNEIERVKRLLSDAGEESNADAEKVRYTMPDAITFKRIQSIPGIDLAAVSLPSEFLGGDYIDSVRLDEEYLILGLFLYDVMGHGMSATDLKAVAKREFGLMREAWSSGKGDVNMLKPGEVVTALNAGLADYCKKCIRFISAFYGVIDVKSKLFTYSSAGHDTPILITDRSEYLHLDNTQLLMGVDEKLTYGAYSLKINKGDVLVLYSDGLTELENPRGEMFERDRLRGVIVQVHALPAQDMITEVFKAITQFNKHKAVHDELTIAVAKIL